eukprot:1531933-Amphidinium_carterae.1
MPSRSTSKHLVMDILGVAGKTKKSSYSLHNPLAQASQNSNQNYKQMDGAKRRKNEPHSKPYNN